MSICVHPIVSNMGVYLQKRQYRIILYFLVRNVRMSSNIFSFSSIVSGGFKSGRRQAELALAEVQWSSAKACVFWVLGMLSTSKHIDAGRSVYFRFVKRSNRQVGEIEMI